MKNVTLLDNIQKKRFKREMQYLHIIFEDLLRNCTGSIRAQTSFSLFFLQLLFLSVCIPLSCTELL